MTPRPALRGHVLAGLLAGLLAASSAGCGPARPGAAVPPPLPPGVRAQHMERDYRVSGTTRAEIAGSLAANAVTGAGGRFQGVHSWHMTWSFRYAPRDGVCRVTHVEVRLRSETIVPRWVDRDRADSALVREWDTYIARLRGHENAHRAIAYRGARAVQRALKRVTAPGCGTLSARGNAAARQVLERYAARNQVYDEKTGHGRTEGAAWPVTPPDPDP